jgi:hypothetical protein
MLLAPTSLNRVIERVPKRRGLAHFFPESAPPIKY